ncbi:MAG: hypothetical protein HYU66_19810 [Armatimonadetes bacterium]|nr:hypothetical protein [Armatimonadota bacterium]
MPAPSSDPSGRYARAAPRRWLAWAVTATLLLMAGGMSWLGWQAGRPWVAEPVAPQALPKPNAADFYLRAAALVADKGVLERAASQPVAGSPAVTPKELAAAVEHNRAALAELRKGFAHKCVVPCAGTFWDRSDSYRQLRALPDLLDAQSAVRVAAGDASGAMDAALDELRLGIDMTHGVPLYADEHGLACQQQARNQMSRCFGGLSPSDAVAVLRRLNGLLSRQVSLHEVFTQDRAWRLAATAEAFEQADWAYYLSWNGTTRAGRMGRLVVRGRRGVMDDLRRLYNHYLDLSSRPYPDLATTPALDGVVAGTLEPMFRGIACNHVFAAADNDLHATSLALWCYANYHGDYPDRLDALVPAFLPRVPMDPFARSAPLTYRPGNGTFRLYSIGPDLRDDGGRRATFQPRSDERWWELYLTAEGDFGCGEDP